MTRTSKRSNLAALISIIILMTLLCGCQEGISTPLETVSRIPAESVSEFAMLEYAALPPENPEMAPTDELLEVHFIDVGQGKSIFIRKGDFFALIDGGDTHKSKALTEYLQGEGVTRLDFIVATHPHADHIGGLPQVIDTFDIGDIYMPDAIATTKIFERLLDSIENKDLKITTPKPLQEIVLGDLMFTVLAPNSPEYSDMNNYSIVMRLTYGGTAFMLTGDAEENSETEILKLASANGLDLSSDVLDCGHHGSNSSASPAFLEAVLPSVCVISCGEGNSYGHPHAETLDALNNVGAVILRTDESGTIIIKSDGREISYE